MVCPDREIELQKETERGRENIHHFQRVYNYSIIMFILLMFSKQICK